MDKWIQLFIRPIYCQSLYFLSITKILWYFDEYFRIYIKVLSMLIDNM